MARDLDESTTPFPLFRACDSLYGPFDFDLAASAENAKCGNYFTKEQDALAQDWAALSATALWCNPPYSRGYQDAFVRKARALAETTRKRTCLLLQSVTDTAWFHDVLMNGGDLHTKSSIYTGPLRGVLLRLTFSMCFLDLHLLRGRVTFLDPLTQQPMGGTGLKGALIAAFRPKR